MPWRPATQIQATETRSSAREGTDEEFDPARQAQYALQSERLYEGLSSQSLIEALLESGIETPDVMSLPKSEEDRRLLASILMHEEEDLTQETVEGAVKALRRIHLQRRGGEAQRAVERPGLSKEEKTRAITGKKFVSNWPSGTQAAQPMARLPSSWKIVILSGAKDLLFNPVYPWNETTSAAI